MVQIDALESQQGIAVSEGKRTCMCIILYNCIYIYMYIYACVLAAGAHGILACIVCTHLL